MPDEFDETADCIGSYYAAVEEMRRRLLAREWLPPEWRPGSYAGPDKAFGISGERVRQILRQFERETGESIPPKPPRQLLRVEWTCDFCGAIHSAAPSVAKQRHCGKCWHQRASLARGGRFSDPATVESLIERRKAGASWLSLARELGIRNPEHQSHVVPAAIWRHLRRERRENEIPVLWPKKAPPSWLSKRWPLSNIADNSR